MKATLKTLLPQSVYRGLAKARYRVRSSPLDPLRRLQPVSPESNARGTSVDRYYIEAFLEANRSAIRGVVLEIAEPRYTQQFGGDAVTRCDILTDPRSGATRGIVGDLRVPGVLAPETYDCIILTQTLQFIDEPLLALDNLFTALKPGGTLLISVPGIAQRDAYDDNLWGDFYRWMPRGFRHLMTRSRFRTAEVAGAGNVLAAQAFIHNMAIEDLQPDELRHDDRDYPLIVTCVARR